jgi:Ca2+-dependent lipid-binding protein
LLVPAPFAHPSPQVDPIVTCDQYVIIKCRDASADAAKIHFETQVVANSLNPVFNRSFEVPNVSRRAIFEICVMDRDITSANDIVGEAELAIWCASQAVEKEVWLTLAKPAGSASATMRGTVGIRFVTHDFGESSAIEGDEVPVPLIFSPPCLINSSHRIHTLAA